MSRLSTVLLLAASGLVICGNAEHSSRFDLVCEGKTTGTRGSHAFQEVLHVDLMRKAYCSNDCRTWTEIHSISDTRITLRDRPSDGYWLQDLAWWEPTSGKYEGHFAATTRAYTETQTHGNCRKARYSGPTEK